MEEKYVTKHKGYRITVKLPHPYPQLLENYAEKIAGGQNAVAAQKIIRDRLDQLVEDGVLIPEVSDRVRAELLQEYIEGLMEGKHNHSLAEKLTGIFSPEQFEQLIERYGLERPKSAKWSSKNS